MSQLIKESDTTAFPYLMKSCMELSAPCSCLTVVAAEATWTEVGMGAVTGGDGMAVTGVPAPGSVFTVGAKRQQEASMRKIHFIIPTF